MARTTQKRKRSNGPFRFTKRRKIMRRRRFGTGKTKSYSTRSLGASNAFQYRGRKVSKKAWRRILRRDTMVATHYNSIASKLATVTTPVAITDCQAVVIPVFEVTFTAGPPVTNDRAFWRFDPGINQQFQPSEYNGTTPVGPDWAIQTNADPIKCIIRGGRYYITINCNSGNDPINFRVQLAFAKQQRRNFAGTAASNTLDTWITTVDAITPKPLTWTYPQQGDYSEFFYRPVMDKTGRLLPGEDMTIVKSIKPVQIDCSQHRDAGGWFPYWFVYCSQSATNVAGQSVVGIVTGYNLSFSTQDDSQ